MVGVIMVVVLVLAVVLVAVSAAGMYYEAVFILFVFAIGVVAGEEAVMFFVFGRSGIGMRIVVCDVIRLLAAGAAVCGLGHCVGLF